MSTNMNISQLNLGILPLCDYCFHLASRDDNIQTTTFGVGQSAVDPPIGLRKSSCKAGNEYEHELDHKDNVPRPTDNDCWTSFLSFGWPPSMILFVQDHWNSYNLQLEDFRVLRCAHSEQEVFPYLVYLCSWCRVEDSRSRRIEGGW